MRIGFVSLGCSKNLVVTEEIIGMFKQKGFEIESNPAIADIIMINTCGFIESAKQESIDTILEMAEYKNDNCKYLIVCGCLVERYKEELQKLIPEVDLFLSIKDYNVIWEEVTKLIGKNDNEHYTLDFKERVLTTGTNYAYIKIAEGCSNGCTYCAIPKIQGPYVSRKMEDILAEAKIIAEKGIEELIVIAQDTGRYGIDIYGEAKLPELLHKLCEIEGIKWIRFLYTYPETITDELIETVKSEPKICKYFDIPIQHASDKILKRMNRKSDKKSIMEIISKLRNEISNVILRTTLIVGFPGETEEDFNELKEFVEWAKFDKLRCF